MITAIKYTEDGISHQELARRRNELSGVVEVKPLSKYRFDNIPFEVRQECKKALSRKDGLYLLRVIEKYNVCSICGTCNKKKKAIQVFKKGEELCLL